MKIFCTLVFFLAAAVLETGSGRYAFQSVVARVPPPTPKAEAASAPPFGVPVPSAQVLLQSQ